MATKSKTQNQNTVVGKVTDDNGHPLANLKVVICDVDIRKWQILAEAYTDKLGNYKVNWSHSQLKGRGIKTANIAVKVLTKEKNTEIFKSSMDEVRFNAGDWEEINIIIHQPLPREVVEFEYLVKQVAFLVEKIPVADLKEDTKNRDITFLSKELDVPAIFIEYFVLAHRLKTQTKIRADFFYGLFRKNTLLYNDYSKTLKARLRIGLNTEIEPLLYDIAITDEQKIKADIKIASSSAEKIISTSVYKNLNNILKSLTKYKNEIKIDFKAKNIEDNIDLLTSLLNKNKLNELQQLLKERKFGLNKFFERISDSSFFDIKEKDSNAQISILVNKIIGFGKEVMPQIVRDKNIKRPEEIRKLVRFNKKEWVDEISKLKPAIKDNKLISNYASTIVRIFENQYPTQAFAAQLQRHIDKREKPVLEHQENIVAFLNKYDDFDLVKDNIEQYFKNKKITIKEADTILEELKSVQRVFKLVPHYSKTLALRNEKIHSAQDVVAIGETRFVKEVAPKTKISEREAREIYRKAEYSHTAAILMLGQMKDILSSRDIAALTTKQLAQKIEKVSEDFPNLKSLFQLTDACECEHCRSVYSPAAYLVEILEFLNNRNVKEGNARDVLFKRRPDIGEIDLNCANANTPVKYIDLVCELLEDAIAPDKGINFRGIINAGKISDKLYDLLKTEGCPVTKDTMIYAKETANGMPDAFYLRNEKLVCKIVKKGEEVYNILRLRQTFSTAEELDAAPEYINTEAYAMLRDKVVCLGVPFDLHHTEAIAYFNRFGVNRPDLMQSFQSDSSGPSDQEIATEGLGLTDAERKIIIEPNPGIQQRYWNTTSANAAVEMKVVDTFLTKSGLTYKELQRLLSLKFINPENKISIKSLDSVCDSTKKEISNLNNPALDRIHRFLRLQKKTGWKFEVLDEIISQAKLGGGKLDDGCLIKAARLKQITEKTKIKAEELVGCFGEIPYTINDKDFTRPLYYKIYLNKAGNGVVDERLLPEKVKENETTGLETLANSIATSLQLKEKDLKNLFELLADEKLNFSNLSFLYTASLLIKNLNLKPEDFVILIELSDQENNLINSPEAILKFIDTIESFRQSPLKASDVKFILKHKAANLSRLTISDFRIEETLATLKDEYQRIKIEVQSEFKTDTNVEEQKEVLSSVLSNLENLNDSDVEKILKFLDKDWTSLNDARKFIDKKLDKGIDLESINKAMQFLNDAEDDNIGVQQNNLINAFLQSITDFQRRISFLEKTISSVFKADEEIVASVLKHSRLHSAPPATNRVKYLLTVDFTEPIDKTNYPKQYQAFQLIHKITFLLDALKLNSIDTEWYFNNNKYLEWFELDSIPYDEGQKTVDFEKYIAFVKAIGLARKYTPVLNPADAERPATFFNALGLTIPESSGTKDELMQNLSLLTGYEKDDLLSVDTHLFADYDISKYRDIKTWERLVECAELLRKLSSTVTQIINYIKPNLTDEEVNELRTTLKSRYDDATWLSTLKEIMDAIRPQKRDALVGFLLATAGLKDKNALYDHLLVDVQMEACMPSSRIVQAHHSIQLFVQRCLMGLEPNAIADVEEDPNWNQWKWMKNYRVWEANRKVFLYPENWYDVTLTSDKSYLLKEFIEEIQQNELTNDTAEEAIRNYLEKLDNIAFLEVKATWYDTINKNMHVFARTKGGDPAIYYYRRFEKERYWTPWEKVELDITGDHLIAFIRNNRLHLAWLIFTEEPDPDQKATVPSQSAGEEKVDMDKAAKKLKIQLAVSEYHNKKWQPKRVSKDDILTPTSYTTNDRLLNRDSFNLMYFDLKQEFGYDIPLLSGIWLVRSSHSKQRLTQTNQSFKNYNSNIISAELPAMFPYTLIGIFNITGGKGYPEVVPNVKEVGLNMLPDFKCKILFSNRFIERNCVEGDDLSVRNAFSILNYQKIFDKTPGTFRLTYPHQLNKTDLLAFLVHSIMFNLGVELDKLLLNPLFGTLLPYFMEDSNHSYVIIPGFYKREINLIRRRRYYYLTDSKKSTASDFFALVDDIFSWFEKMHRDFSQNPVADLDEAIERIITDDDFKNLLSELSKYETFDFILNFLIGKTGNEEFDSLLDELRNKQGLFYGKQFKNLYHPLTGNLRSALYKDGVPGLMARETQLEKTDFDFKKHYAPNEQIVAQSLIKNSSSAPQPSFPIEDIDFSSDGSYSVYNWDLFFRIPLHIATSLTGNQRFEEALDWFHYMFNPTGALSGDGVQKYWVTKPFYLNQASDYISQRIDNLLSGTVDLEFEIEEWRNKPFQPDVVARSRPVAYQKALLMKYIDNLTEWGDYLFRQDTMESIAQATQMYILADKLLGPKPKSIPPVKKPVCKTYNQIEVKLDSFGNALIELENIIPIASQPDLPQIPRPLPPRPWPVPNPPITLSMMYFCIPQNDKMLEYWDKIADRLFKIRHCQNIDGVKRSLALFAPPIDPGMLVRAAAAGLDISSILAGINAPTPYYRFNILSQKATELAQEVRGLGNSLLQALEKKDAEALTLLRSEQELKVLNAVKDIKKLQIDEAKEQIEVLKRTKKVTEERHKYYSSIHKISSKEQLNLDKLSESHRFQTAAQGVKLAASLIALIPDLDLGASGWAASPVAKIRFGGLNLSQATNAASDILSFLGMMASNESARASIHAGYDRRHDDWKLQEHLAKLELNSIEKQITAAEIRKEIAETDFKNHELQIENARKTDEFMRSKFTNKELYDWMIGQISSVYFRSYQLAHDFAKKAERCYRFELGNDDAFIDFGYWDSMKKGLQSADRLIHDIKRMETSYLDKNKREYEITKHVSLVQLDPLALIRLRATGICDFEIPEALYDMDHPGQYFRRIKSVSMSLPCITGPYTSVSAKLSLVNNRYRKNPIPGDNGYAEDPGNDDRFIYNVGAIQSIATSNAQNDSGVFELNFRDERYLPFENAGAISSWRLELPTEVKQFDYNTISDVIIHVKYTAREGGSTLKNEANVTLKHQLAAIKQDLNKTGLHLAINMKHELSNEWNLLRKNGTINLTIDKSRLPYMVQGFDSSGIESVMFLVKVRDNPEEFEIFVKDDSIQLGMDELGLYSGICDNIELDTPFTFTVSDEDKSKLEELMMVIKYAF